jgi:hypothetical protein
VWRASIAEPNALYEQHATDKPKKFFYHIDIQGRVLRETLPKNIATSLKNPGFLDFFFIKSQDLFSSGSSITSPTCS